VTQRNPGDLSRVRIGWNGCDGIFVRAGSFIETKGDILASPFSRAGIEEMREKSQPRVPFGHPGLEIRHPLRGLGGKAIVAMNIIPAARHNYFNSEPRHWDG
jgi:hypothetical protein